MKWIPCSEKLPTNDDWVIVSVLDEVGDTPYRYSDFGWYFDRAKCWIVESEQRTDIVAWMPLPKPYTADRKTEPQTDNGIGCSKCESRFWCMDRDMPHAVHCNNYGKVTDEPQTDCSWK